MAGRAGYQYTASDYWTRPGRVPILVEVCKDFRESEAPAMVFRIQNDLEGVLKQLGYPSQPLGAGTLLEAAKQIRDVFGTIGGAVAWVRCSIGPMSVTAYIEHEDEA